MPDNAPFEILSGPISAWWAPVGEAFPLIDETPAGNWALIGTNGDRNYSEDGVQVFQDEEQAGFKVLGSTGEIKSRRTDVKFRVAFTMFDMTLENYRHAVNLNTVTTTPAASGVAGFKSIDLYKGLDVAQMALLLRGIYSPYGPDWNAQFQIPVVVENGTAIQPIFQKSEPLGVALEFMAQEDPNAALESGKFGQLLFQDADALP